MSAARVEKPGGEGTVRSAGRGCFITFEGGEGTGKSTQLNMLADALRSERSPVAVTREPGGTAGAEAVRRVLLGGGAEPLGSDAEALLFAAARADLVDHVIKPALRRGEHVLCDRYIDSSRAYQRASPFLPHIERIAIGGLVPDLTLIFDLDPEIGRERVRSRDGSLDRFEGSSVEELDARRQTFLEIAEDEPRRCVVIDASNEASAVHLAVLAAVAERLELNVGQVPAL